MCTIGGNDAPGVERATSDTKRDINPSYTQKDDKKCHGIESPLAGPKHYRQTHYSRGPGKSLYQPVLGLFRRQKKREEKMDTKWPFRSACTARTVKMATK